MAFPVAVVFVVVFSLTAVDSTVVSNCLGKNKESMLEVDVGGCDEAPCIIHRNTTVDVDITFKLDHEVEQLKHSVYVQISGIRVPFVGVDGKTACDNVYQEDRVTRARCPLAPEGVYVYLNQFPVLPSYPKMVLLVHWALQDVVQHQDVTCFDILAKIA